MVLRFFIFCTAISICVRAHPSRLKILPGLAFYRTDDGHDDSDNSLMDKDKDLLKSMWNIVDKMDTKASQGPGFPKNSESFQAPASNEYPTFRRPSNEFLSGVRTSSGGPPFHKSGTPNNQGAANTPGNSGPGGPGGPGSPGLPAVPGAPGAHGAGGRTAPLGTPITTINVYSTYPGATVKGETPFTATTYHHGLQSGSYFGANPFSSTADMAPRNIENQYNQNMIPNIPSFDGPKAQRNNFDPFMAPGGSPAPYEPSTPPQDSMISQAQYESLMNTNGGIAQQFEGQMENSETMGRTMYDAVPNQGEDHGYGGGMENSAGSAPIQFLMPQMSEDNAPMRSIEDMMQDNYQNMNTEQLRSHMY